MCVCVCIRERGRERERESEKHTHTQIWGYQRIRRAERVPGTLSSSVWQYKIVVKIMISKPDHMGLNSNCFYVLVKIISFCLNFLICKIGIIIEPGL